MASTTINPTRYNHYNGKWSGWSSNLYGGYSGKKLYGTVLRYTVPSGTFAPPYTFKVKIPWIRQSSSATSGTFTVYLFTVDPTGAVNTEGDYQPDTVSSSNYKAKGTVAWSGSDQELQTDTVVTITWAPTSATTATYFYIWIANSVDFLEIGYKGEVVASDYAMTITHSTNTVRVYNGSSWVTAVPYVYNGSSWVAASARVYNGSSWV